MSGVSKEAASIDGWACLPGVNSLLIFLILSASLMVYEPESVGSFVEAGVVLQLSYLSREPAV